MASLTVEGIAILSDYGLFLRLMFDRIKQQHFNNCSKVIIMAVIFKDVLIEEKTEEEKQHILSILNGEYNLSDDVSRRLRRLNEESKRLEVFVKETHSLV